MVFARSYSSTKRGVVGGSVANFAYLPLGRLPSSGSPDFKCTTRIPPTSDAFCCAMRHDIRTAILGLCNFEHKLNCRSDLLWRRVSFFIGGFVKFSLRTTVAVYSTRINYWTKAICRLTRLGFVVCSPRALRIWFVYYLVGTWLVSSC